MKTTKCVLVLCALLALALAVRGTDFNIDDDELSVAATVSLLARLSPASAGETCTGGNCVLAGQQCGGDLHTRGACREKCCALGLTCHQGVCKANNFGQRCTTAADCFTFMANTAVCVSGACQPVMFPGDTCKSSEQCVGGSVCSQGVCVGVAQGGNCTVSSECVYPLYCGPTGNCAPLREAGESCLRSSDCQFERHCVAGVCQPAFNLSAGAACSPSYHFWEQQCAAGLACDAQTGTCVQPTVGWSKKCASNATCGGYSCQCNELVGQSQCATDYMPSFGCNVDSAHNCKKKHACRGTISHFFPGTCIYERCNDAFQKTVRCSCATIQHAVGNCLYFPFPGGLDTCAALEHDGLSGGQVAGIIIGLMFGIVIVFAVIFWIAQRRGPDPNYQQL